MASALTYIRSINDPHETHSFAGSLVPYLRQGDVLLLNGDMGAGKTFFVQSVANHMGIEENVVSPTFNIQLSYTGPQLDLNHFDLYRLENRSELEDIGYWETLESDGVSFVEWGDKFPQSAPLDYLQLRFLTLEEECRRIVASAHGQRARRLLYIWAQDELSMLEQVRDYDLDD